MQFSIKSIALVMLSVLMSSCLVSKKKYELLQNDLKTANETIASSDAVLSRFEATVIDYQNKLNACLQQKTKLQGDVNGIKKEIKIREEQLEDAKRELADAKSIRDKQINQVGDLTDLSNKASDNIKETLSQLGKKDSYIQMLQVAKTRADSINLALAVNLKSVLKDGIEDADIEVKVDKTVVFINLSDKMLFQSGQSSLTSRADEVLQKIATIIQSRPELEVMVEGYTDNVPINSACIKDNWELSVKRSTSVVKVLQNKYKIDPNRLIAAGRGQYNALADNATAVGRATNRRTRIIILPKLDQFYDLLNPNVIPK
jgi:chemotaxis protein MotB